MDGSNDTGNNSRTTLDVSDNISTNSITHGELLCWGCGEFGQHCHGHSGDVGFSDAMVDPRSLEGSSGGVSAVACGSSHTVLVTGSGQIYVWGNGNSGQLGCGDQTSRWKPTQIHLSLRLPPGATIRSVACGSRHTMVVLTNGHVYSFGNNFYAQLGYNFREKNYKENQLRPQLLEFLVSRPVRQVSCGDKHSLFLFHDGDVAAVGNNAHGQIGDGGHHESVVPKPVELDHPVREITCGPNHNLVITEEGQLYIWGYSKACGRRRHDVRLPEHIDIKGKEIRQAAGGSSHSLALTVKGKVYSWGFGPDGQLGLGPDLLTSAKPHRLRHSVLAEGVSRVACGDAFSAAVTVTGRLCMWGRNSHTIETGLGSLHRVFEPRCLTWGADRSPTLPESRTIRSVECGAWHAAALIGLPEPLPHSSDSDESYAETEDGSIHSVSSWASSVQDFGDEDLNTTVGDIEVSAPPQATSSSGSKVASFVVPRGQTKLTLAEFYATTDSNRSVASSDKTFIAPTAKRGQPQVSQVHAASVWCQNELQSPPPRPLPVEVPTATGEPDSDEEDPLSPSANSSRSPAAEVDQVLRESKVKSSPASLPRVHKQKTAIVSDDVSSRNAVGVKPPSSGVSGREGGHVTGSRSKVTQSKVASTVQVSRTPAKNFSLPREPTVVVNKRMDFLDPSQLLTGSGAHVTGTSARAFGVRSDSDLGSLTKEQSTTSIPGPTEGARERSGDVIRSGIATSGSNGQHVPIVHLEGVLGVAESGYLPCESQTAHRPLQDLKWFDELPSKTVSNLSPLMKRSPTLIGALPGQWSRSPSKFYHKPASKWVLNGSSRLLTTAPTSSLPPSLIRAKTFAETVGSQQKVMGEQAIKKQEKQKSSKATGKEARDSGKGARGENDGPSGVKTVLPGLRKVPSCADPEVTHRNPIFSSATSWQQRHQGNIFSPDPAMNSQASSTKQWYLSMKTSQQGTEETPTW